MPTAFSRLWSTAARGAAPGIWPLLAVTCLVSALGLQAAGRPAATGGVRLESILGRVDRQTAAILIQTSEPVPYVTNQPDPLTVLVDLRNVASAGVSNRFVATDASSVSEVSVEDTTAFDGAPVARVRVSLARPLVHRVRCERNVIRVEVDREALAGSSPAARVEAPASERGADGGSTKRATRLQAVRAVDGQRGPIIVLEGNGALPPPGVQLTKSSPYRLIFDFPGVRPAVKATTPVAKGPVDRVRVALNSSQPPLTRVVVDLTGPVPYKVDQADGRISIAFGDEAAQPDAQPATMLSDEVPALLADGRPAEPEAANGARPAPPAGDTASAPATPAAATQPVLLTPPADPTPVPPPPAASTAPPAASAPAPAASAPRSTLTVPPDAVAMPMSAPSSPGNTPAAPAGAPAVTSGGARPAAQQAEGGQKKYTGAPISLDFAGADIRSVLRVFSETSGLNIIIDPKVQGTVDVALRDVPWDQALDIILRSAGLGYAIDGNVVRIAPLNVLQEEEKQRRSLADEQAASSSIETLTRTLSYAKADDMRGLITRSSAITKFGKVEVDARTNTLIVRDIASSLPTVARILDDLDKPQPQVEIEARIVQTTRNFARQLGIQWGFSGRLDPALGNTTPLAFPNRGAVGGATGTPVEGTGTPSVVNLRTSTPPNSAIGLAMGSVNGAFNLDVQLSALETTGQGRILSTPRVLAQNNFAAMMMQGVEIPIQTVANNTVTVTFKPAALTLEVTPQITAAGTVILSVKVENASADYTKQVNGIPPINTQRANTQVLVKDNDTIVIGGVYVSQEQAQNDRTPGLHRIPLLGWLFRRDVIDDQANELLIFITPRIIKG